MSLFGIKALKSGIAVVAVALLLSGRASANAVQGQSPTDQTHADATEEVRLATIQKGLKFLAESGQEQDGSFSPRAGSGITALAVTAALRNGAGLDDPLVTKGLAALEAFIQADGGIYGGGRLKNYETCVAMMALAEANRDGKYDAALAKARDFLGSLQGGVESGDPADPWQGGVGYAGAGRPDLSNTAYFIEALRTSGAGHDDPAIQRAIAFVARCQNLSGQGNDTDYAPLVNDGGFYYEIPKDKPDPANATTDAERFTKDGGLRSYGSMTYSGLKSMVFAGLSPDDPRVVAALRWIKAHYSVSENPGMGTAGLFYYYHTFAAALHAAGIGELETDDGQHRNWRDDLVRQLASVQNKDGSWSNANARWFEDDQNLATSFSLLALACCAPDVDDEEGK